MKKFKIYIFSFFIFLLVFLNFENYVVEADVVSSALTLSAISAENVEFGPVALLGASALAIGLVYQNQNQLLAIGQQIESSIVSSGHSVSDIISNDSVTMTSWYKSLLSSIIFPSSVDLSPLSSVNLSGDSIGNFSGVTATGGLGFVGFSSSYITTLPASDYTISFSGSSVSSMPSSLVPIFEDNGIFVVPPYSVISSSSGSYTFSLSSPVVFTGFGMYNPSSSISYSDYSLRYISLVSYAPSVDLSGVIANESSSSISAYPDNDVISFSPSVDLANVRSLSSSVAADSDGVISSAGTSSSSLDLSVPSSVPSLNFTPLELDLSEKFPFCIPFDLVGLITSFSSSSQAPSFTFNFPSINLGSFGNLQGASFIWDFSQFSTLASICRYFVLIVFVANLIKITRSILGG